MSNRSGLLVNLLFAVMMWPAAASVAQSLSAAREERKQDSAPASGAQTGVTRVLPEARIPADLLAAIDRIRLEKVVVEGRSLISDEELAVIVAPYQARDVTVEELYTLRREISEAYVRRGYINSGVILADQKVSNGTVVMKEVRGSLTVIHVSGNERLSPKYITGRLSEKPGQPLRLDRLRESLELLRLDPRIGRLNARLLPGLRPGESELQLIVRRNGPFQVAVGADNLSSAGTGGERGTLSVSDMNVTGRGDTLIAQAGVSEGRGMGSLLYSVPLNARNTALQAEFGIDDARIIEEPFDRIDIRSRTKRGALSVAHPWILHPNRTLVTSAGFERRHSSSTLLGIPFSFSPGDREGKSDTSVVNAGVEFTARGRSQVLAVRATLRRGVDLLQATIHDNGPDGRFTALLGQFQYARSLGPNGSELLFRWTGQLSADPLLALEKMPIGGFNTVRGYRENQFVRDNGQAASVEWRVPIRRLSTGEGFAPLNLQVAPFVDLGRSWDVNDRNAEEIYSSGIGLLWSPVRALRLDVYWGYAFRDVANAAGNLQDRGIHFRLRYAYSF